MMDMAHISGLVAAQEAAQVGSTAAAWGTAVERSGSGANCRGGREQERQRASLPFEACLPCRLPACSPFCLHANLAPAMTHISTTTPPLPCSPLSCATL